MIKGACSSFIHIALSLWKWQPVEYVALQRLVKAPPIVSSGPFFLSITHFTSSASQPFLDRVVFEIWPNLSGKNYNTNDYNRVPTFS